MDSTAISRFKATFLAVLERVKKTWQPLLITKRVEPIAQVIPPAPRKASEEGTFGCLADSIEIRDDIVEPVGEEDREEAFQKDLDAPGGERRHLLRERSEQAELPPLTRSLLGVAAGSGVEEADWRRHLERKQR